MANFKRRRPKNARSGCLMCKPHKGNGMSSKCQCETSNGRKEYAAKDTLKRYMDGKE